MDFNSLLVWTVCLSCTALLLRGTRLPWKETRGWMGVSGFLLMITGTTVLFLPAWSGWISGFFWLLLIFIPLISLQQINSLFYQEKYRQARHLSSWIRWLHPADGWWEQPQLLHALEIAQRGEIETAKSILDRYHSENTASGRIATILVYRITADWSKLLTWCERNLPTTLVASESMVIVYYLRALGETGDLNRLLQEFEKFQPAFVRSNNWVNLNLARLFVLAFCGEVEAVQTLFERHLKMYSNQIQQFWIATAEMARGNRLVAKQQLERLREQDDVILKNAIAWRFSRPCANPHHILTPASWESVSRMITEIDQESRYTRLVGAGKIPYATLSIIGINLVFFALEIQFGGSENPMTLYGLGALVPEIVWQGEWWRLLSATFLHFGVFHLIMNMIGLYLLGPLVEAAWGVRRYLITYFGSGIGSMFIITLMALLFPGEPQFVVGASGAILGLIGVIAAILLEGWRREKAVVAARGLRFILMMITFQVFFDLTTPQISFLGHISGIILGFLIGNVLIYVKGWQRYFIG